MNTGGRHVGWRHVPRGRSPWRKPERVEVSPAPMLLRSPSWTAHRWRAVSCVSSAKPRGSLDAQSIWETPERCLKFESFYNKKGSVVFCFFVLSLHVGCVLYSNDCIDMTYGTCEGVACHPRFSSSDQSRGTRDFTFSRLKLFSSFIAISSTYHIV